MSEKINHYLSVGMDIGASSGKLALVNNVGNVLYVARKVHTSAGPRSTAEELVEGLKRQVPLSEIKTAAITGASSGLYKGQAGWHTFTPGYSDFTGFSTEEIGTIIDIGGARSLVIGFKEGSRQWQAEESSACAAGTGKFLEQQAIRLGINIEEFGLQALEWEEIIPRVAARCSVFAKSDLIHLQQKGWPVSAMLAGLAESVARMVQTQWRDKFKTPVYCIGGVAANEAIIRALKTVSGVPNIIVPDYYESRGAIGVALLSQNAQTPPTEFYPNRNEDSQLFFVPNDLNPVPPSTEWTQKEIETGQAVYMGVDVGSTSTKIVFIDSSGEVLAKKYIMTAGQPLKAIQDIMFDPDIAKLEGKINIKGVGVTGSGRYLVGNAIGADLIKNEITAQTRAAIYIDPNVETVFELGGQDSKYILLRNGVVLDYQMNKACAAGTGSFIDELAEQLGVSTRNGDFACLAFKAVDKLDLGEKCTAFMGQDVTQALNEGVPLEVIVAGLPTSLVANYLSKVVAGRRIGKRILLTGAVFHNKAVVSAFKAKLPEYEFIVPEHIEVTGAIGAALLAKKEREKGDVLEGTPSQFKGISRVADEFFELKYFNCGSCDQSCAISVLEDKKSGKASYYGSRCDKYDAQEKSGKKTKVATPFDIREALLLEGYDSEKGTGALVGVPRALMAYDYAPMIIGFLNALGVRIIFTSQTTEGTKKRSTRAYPDSCFPLKVLHGHVDKLLEENPDYILIPNAIRMRRKTSNADQGYSCPLVQNAPYLIKSAYEDEFKDTVLLDPIIDFSHGDGAIINSLVDIAKRIGFSKREGKTAARAGLVRQRQFEEQLQEAGTKILDELVDDTNALGVVLISRAYNAQDSGMNLGMATELRKRGIVPMPMDFLPLEGEDVSDVTDRPYWNYERKILAATKFIAKHPQLFGLFLSNFGCGPNSFIEKEVEDIMEGKPLGQIEVDEHAAEAGYITRLEAYVDTIRGHRQANLSSELNPERYTRLLQSEVTLGETVLIPQMSDHAFPIAAAMRVYGVEALVLPPSDKTSLVLSREVTNGRECLPFRDALGVILRAAQEGSYPENASALMAGAFGPCRLGKYAQEMQVVLKRKGIPWKIRVAVSDNAYADLGLGKGFERLAWKGIVGVDLLQKMLLTTRPYEKEAGEAEKVYGRYLNRLSQFIKEKRDPGPLLGEAKEEFSGLVDHSLPKRPLAGINGEIYLRANSFCNNKLVELCEAAGLEVEVAPMSEWIKYINFRRVEDALADKDWVKLAGGLARQWVMGNDESGLTAQLNGINHNGKEPSTKELINASSPYIPSRNGSEAVLSIGSGDIQMRNLGYAGVISVMPLGCMPGVTVASLAEHISRKYDKPWIGLAYDGNESLNARIVERIATFAERIHSQRLLVVN